MDEACYYQNLLDQVDPIMARLSARSAHLPTPPPSPAIGEVRARIAGLWLEALVRVPA